MSYLFNSNHEKSHILSQIEIGDHLFYLEKIYFYDFQETIYSVVDILGDYDESFNTLEEAQIEFNRIVMEAKHED